MTTTPIDPTGAERLDGARVDVATRLFAAWSSGDVDAPRQFLAEDAVLFDIIGGEYGGWPAIREYFGRGLARYPDLTLVPTGDFWFRPDGLSMLWVMSASVQDDRFGEHNRGRRWQAEGLSYLVFEGLTVVREADYHDHGSRERSLGLTPA